MTGEVGGIWVEVIDHYYGPAHVMMCFTDSSKAWCSYGGVGMGWTGVSNVVIYTRARRNCSLDHCKAMCEISRASMVHCVTCEHSFDVCERTVDIEQCSAPVTWKQNALRSKLTSVFSM